MTEFLDEISQRTLQSIVRHTSKIKCPFPESKTNEQLKHAVREYISTASVSERLAFWKYCQERVDAQVTIRR